MGCEPKRLELEAIREREMSIRDPKSYQPETIRAFYLNDVGALLAEVERLRVVQQESCGSQPGPNVNSRMATDMQTRVLALRIEVERLASGFHTRNEPPSHGVATAPHEL